MRRLFCRLAGEAPLAKLLEIKSGIENSLFRQAVYLVALPLLLQIALIAVLWTVMQQIDEERKREVYAREVTYQINSLLHLALKRSTSSVVQHIIGGEASARSQQELSIQIGNQLASLDALTASHEYERAQMEKIHNFLEASRNDMSGAQELYDNGEKLQAVQKMLHLQLMLDQFFKMTTTVVEEQQRVQSERKDTQERLRQYLKWALLVGISADVALAIFLVYSFNNRTSSRLDILVANALRLASGQPLAERLGGQDEIAHLDHVFHDVYESLTDARHKEQAIVENVLAIICSLDEKGRFENINQACEQYWGWSAEELIGKRLSSIVHPEDWPNTNKVFEKVMRSQSKGTIENRIMTKSNGSVSGNLQCETHWALYWSVPEKKMFCIAQDIGERKRVDRMKRDFIAMVSHDLKTPLTSIQMIHSLFEAEAYGKLNEDGHESLGIARDETQRLIRLVSDLLDIEAMETGQMNLNMQTNSVESIITKAAAAVFPSASFKKQNIKVSIAPDVTTVMADSDRMNQVLHNLLQNAIKFSPDGSDIMIAAVNDEKYGKFVEFRVSDSGKGVPLELQSSIFDKFRQVSITEDRKLGGSGLGLAIAKTIVERHLGQIGVSSNSGDGSTFWFRLPKTTHKLQ